MPTMTAGIANTAAATMKTTIEPKGKTVVLAPPSGMALSWASIHLPRPIAP